MNKMYLVALGLLIAGSTIAQKTTPTENVGIGTKNPDNSAVLDIQSVDKGLLIPRLSLSQRNSIPTPANGLMIYQINDKSGFYYFDGNAWKPLGDNDAKSVALDVQNWSKTGDAGTNSATNFLGTLDNQPLILKANNIRVAYFDNATGVENIFLGKEAGSTFANIAGSGYYNVAIGNYALKSGTVANANIAIGYRSLFTTQNSNGNSAIGAYSLENATTGSYNMAIGGNALKALQIGSGNLAIGVNSLTHTNGYSNNAFGFQSGMNKNGSGNVYIGANAGAVGTFPGEVATVTEDFKLYIATNNTLNPLIKGDFTTGSLKINVKPQVGGSPTLGTLSIGDFDASTSPQMTTPLGYRLVVQDGILTEKIKVALRTSGTDWADYVFEPSYKSKMLSLEEVEKFTIENKHLPNVPSAEEMVKTGLDVSQTSKMFMEKIEELTLYMIEMNKEIKALKAENQILKKK